MQVKRAAGARVNGLIDFTSGWLVANIGHDNRAVMRAVRKARGWAVISEHPNSGLLAASDAMISILPAYLRHIQFYNSGSEAIDAAMRFTDAPFMVKAHPRAYHGSTIGAQSVLRQKFTDPMLDSTAVLVETFHGPWCEWHTSEEIDALREHQVRGGVLIFDEMQAGFGRTGRWWGFEHYDIKPDIVVGGKAMAGGFPMAFVAWTDAVHPNSTWPSTFSGNALSCAACVATIREIRRRKLLERVVALEPLISGAFPQAQGKGFAYAFEHSEADAVVDRALERGLMLLHTGRGTVKICPPLCISKRALLRGLEILRSAV